MEGIGMAAAAKRIEVGVEDRPELGRLVTFSEGRAARYRAGPDRARGERGQAGGRRSRASLAVRSGRGRKWRARFQVDGLARINRSDH